MATTARQVVFHGVDTVGLEQVEIPTLGTDEVLVAIRRVGICATDLHLLAGHLGDVFPVVPGHEFVGEVAAIGPSCRRELQVGDAVAVEMLVPCATCARCREGRYNLCERDMEPGSTSGRQLGITVPRSEGSGLNGGYADYLVAPAAAIVHRLSQPVDWDAATLVEPLAVAFRALHRGRLAAGDDVVIVGPGPVGLLVAAAARASGASRIAVVGTRASRLQLATRFGADLVINSREQDPRDAVLATFGRLPDLVVETAGVPAAQQTSIRAVRHGGRVVLAGACGAGAALALDPDGELLTREIDVLPSFLSAGGYEPAIAMLTRAEFPFADLVTHRFPLDDVEQAFEVVRSRADDALKVVLTPTP